MKDGQEEEQDQTSSCMIWADLGSQLTLYSTCSNYMNSSQPQISWHEYLVKAQAWIS